MAQGLYSGVSGLALGTGLYRNVSGLWGGASGLIDGFGGGGSVTPSLDLNLLSGPLDPRITFSRTSQATLVDSTGKLTYAPNNLLLNSQEFEAALWAKSAAGTGSVPVVTANAAIAPDGTTTADQLVFALNGGTTSSDWSWITQGYTAVAGGTYIISLWARTISGTAKIIVDNTSNDANLADITTTWTRVSFVRTDATGGGRTVRIGLRGNNVASGQSGSATVLFWGAQLEQVTYQTTPGTYNSTSPSNLLGYTQEFDNGAWIKSNSFIQTNLLTYSQAVDNAVWTKANSFVQTNLLLQSQAFDTASWNKGTGGSISANSVVAPDGTTTADAYTRATTTGSYAFLSQEVASTSTNPHTFSIWLKRPAGSGSRTIKLVVSDVTTSTGSSDNLTVTESWQRFEFTRTSAASTGQVGVGFSAGTTGTPLAGGEVVDVWGAQLVQGAVAGNYQQTDAAAAPVQYLAPDNTLSAEKVVENTVSGRHGVNQSISSSALVYTASVYAKRGENDFLAFAPGGSGQPNTFTWFNLATGAIGTNNNTSASMLDVGNGWYRCSITFTAIAGTLAPLVETSKANGSNVYLGDGTSGIYVWGAQLVQGADLGNYQQTIAAAATVQYMAPDGSMTADKLSENTATTGHGVYQAATTVTGVPYTWAGYVKAAGRDIVRFDCQATGVIYAVEFNLNSVTTTNRAGSGTATISSVGNGWYRISATATSTASGTGYWQVSLCPTAGTVTYTGDGTSGIYVWGAQLSNSASLDPYVYNPVAAPTSAAYYGPRFDYEPVTLAPKGLLIEEQRTNLLTYSDQFDNAIWGKTNSTIAANVIISPDGTVNADKLQEDSATAGHVLVANPTMAASTTYTLSVYMKAAERTFGVMNIYTGVASCWTWFNLSTGVVSTLGAGATATITPAANGWYRCTLTIATAATGSPNVAFWPANANGSLSYAGTTGYGIYIYGAQLEAGSFATSYIPTVASQVTRTADNATMQGANFSNWYNQNEGTFVGVFDYSGGTSASNPSGRFVLAASNATPNNLHAIYNRTSVAQSGLTSDGGVTQAAPGIGTSLDVNTVANTAYAYKQNDFAFTYNGSAAATDVSGTVPTNLTVLAIGGSGYATPAFLNGHIRRIGYYNTRLPNATLVTLTAPPTTPSLSLDFTTQVFNVG